MASSFCESPSPCSETLKKNFPSFGVLVSNDLMELIDEEKREKGEGERERKKKERSYIHTYTPSSPLFAHLTTMDELLNHVKNYIVKHQLYDPANPVKIMVHENALGALLGKSEFSLHDVRDLLLETCAFPVTEKNASEVICSPISEKKGLSKKRKLVCDKNDSLSEFSAKRNKKKNFESDESMHSYQDYETDFVQDSTSEENFSLNGLIIAETFDFDVQYEIETETTTHTPRESDGEYSCSYDSESDLEDFVKSAIISFIAQTESDIEYLADQSSDEESELELSEEDKWKCHSCGTLNDPVFGCCCLCWRTRLGWLSERSERKIDFSRKNRKEFLREKHNKNKRKLSKKRESNKNKDSNCKTSDLSSATESLSPASSSSFCNDNSDANLSDLSSAPTTVSLSSPSTSSNNSSDVIFLSKSPSNTDKESDVIRTEVEKQKAVCLFCCSKPADSTIIHGKLGCRVCCFTCGKKIFAENQRCPVCRRTIERIVYLYNL